MLVKILQERTAEAMEDTYNRWWRAKQEEIKAMKTDLHSPTGGGVTWTVVVWYEPIAEHLPRRKRAKADVSPEG